MNIKAGKFVVLLGLIFVIQGCGDSGLERLGIDISGRGCGSGWNTNVVRDEYWDVTFNAPCRHHDMCYETCGLTRAECDDIFYDELKASCEETYPDANDEIQRTACQGAARIYYESVRAAGEDAFSDAQEIC